MDIRQAHMLVEYVFNRPKGEPKQELGGVMNTLALLAQTEGMNMWEEAEIELTRCWDNIEKIKTKNKTKPRLNQDPNGADMILAKDMKS
jgi:hypothetical protein